MGQEYIVSARKYRPDSFATIVGQEAMTETLKTAVLEGKLAHAYLFCGPRGVGKTTAARVLAKTINCMNLTPEGEACNSCESCRAFNEQRSFNVFELDAASNNSVDDIRLLTDQVAVAPALGQYKVYIIDEVHMLSVAAFNAFLKTLEEPPRHALFILATTERHKVLPTILSRCQTYDFRRITVADIANHLAHVAQNEGVTTEETALELIAEKADGGMRDALSLFDRIASFSGGNITYQVALESLNILDYSYFIQLTESLLQGDYASLLLTLDAIMAKGFDGQLIASGMAAFLRDLLVVSQTATADLLEKPQRVKEAYLELAKRCTLQMLFMGIRGLAECDRTYREASNRRLHLELAMLSLLGTFCPEGALRVTAPQPIQLQPRHPQAGNAPSPSATSSEQAKRHIAPANGATPPTATAPPPTQSEKQASSEQPPEPSAKESTPETPPQTKASNRRPLSIMRNRKKEGSTNLAPTSQRQEPFTEEALQESWLSFAITQFREDQILLRQRMQNHLPRLNEAGEVEIIVGSTTIQESIEQILPKVLPYLRDQLKNDSLSPTIRLEVSQETSTPITAQERLQEMTQVNPAISQVIERLSLSLNGG